METNIQGDFSAATIQAADKNLWSPIVRNVAIALVSKWGDTPILQSGLTVLVDTGADRCVIDIDIASKQKIPVAQTIKDVTVNGTSDVPIYLLDFVPPDGSRLHMACVGAPLRLRGFQFDAIWGMDAIGHFVLTVDRTSQSVSLRRQL